MKLKKENKLQFKLKPKRQLRRPLQKECFKCSASIEVKDNPGQGDYSKKNNWGYWTSKKENLNKYICDKCLVHLYREDKWEYRENITNLARRRVLRTYIYDQKIA